VVTRETYTGHPPPVGSVRYVRLDDMVREVVVQPYDERLIRTLGGCISGRLITGVYRNFYPRELKASASPQRPATQQVPRD
jgi:hypothetical protein